MNARQAKALLELLADLYIVASTPDPPTEPAAVNNGQQAKVRSDAAR